MLQYHYTYAMVIQLQLQCNYGQLVIPTDILQYHYTFSVVRQLQCYYGSSETTASSILIQWFGIRYAIVQQQLYNVSILYYRVTPPPYSATTILQSYYSTYALAELQIPQQLYCSYSRTADLLQQQFLNITMIRCFLDNSKTKCSKCKEQKKPFLVHS